MWVTIKVCFDKWWEAISDKREYSIIKREKEIIKREEKVNLENNLIRVEFNGGGVERNEDCWQYFE
jgi:hypothetical protein